MERKHKKVFKIIFNNLVINYKIVNHVLIFNHLDVFFYVLLILRNKLGKQDSFFIAKHGLRYFRKIETIISQQSVVDFLSSLIVRLDLSRFKFEAKTSQTSRIF